MILLDDNEIFELLPGYYDSMRFMWLGNPENDPSTNVYPAPDYIKLVKSTGKKIAIKLQAIYNLPDGGMFHKKMGEFIEQLLKEVKQ